MSEGFVRLVARMDDGYDTGIVNGCDLAIVNSARQSYGRRVIQVDPKDISVIEMMFDKKHGTPFEGPVFRFHIRCSIKEARDWFRYRFSSYNEYSTRFSKLIEDWYIPVGDAIRTGSASKLSLVPIEDTNTQELITNEFIEAYEDSKRHYLRLRELGLAQEAASYVYTLGNMTEFTWTVNARTLMNFWAQRMDGAALLELRRKSFTTFGLVEPYMYETTKLWSKYNQPDMFSNFLEGDVWLPEHLR